MCIESQVSGGLHFQGKDIGQDFNYYSLPLPKHIQHYADHVGCHCALKETVKFIGAEERTAASRYWGYKWVGKGMATVTVDEIFISNVKPQFLFPRHLHQIHGTKKLQLGLYFSNVQK